MKSTTDMNKIIHEKMMEHWRKCYGVGGTFPFSDNPLMIELGMKEFYEAGFRAGVEEARNADQ